MTLALKQRIRAGEVTLGSWVMLGHPAIGEILVRAGFDWLAIDMEHTAITLGEVQPLVQVIDLAGCTPLVRVYENAPSLIKRVMDTGAHGVIVPMINSRADAEQAVQAIRYPPYGTRGVGLGRAQGYGADFEGYRDRREKDSLLIIQIEHVQAVERLEDILSVEGIDGLLIGPYDLSGSLGVPGQFDHPEVQHALRRIKTVAASRRIAAGVHVISPDPQEVLAAVREGLTLLPFSFDTRFLSEMATSRLQQARQLLAKEHRPVATGTR